MGIVRFVLWSAVCVALGVFVARFELGGQTPIDRLGGLWKEQAPRLEKVKDGAGVVMDDVKKKLAGAPTERHSTDDREAVNQLIAKRQAK